MIKAEQPITSAALYVAIHALRGMAAHCMGIVRMMPEEVPATWLTYTKAAFVERCLACGRSVKS